MSTKLGSPPKDLYANVIQVHPDATRLTAHRGSAPPQVTVGGWDTPVNHGLSYLLGARALIERGDLDDKLDELALPILFLQRHALELGLKTLIVAAGIARMAKDTALAREADPSAKLVAPKQPHGHSMPLLLSDATAAVEYMGFEFPECLSALTIRLEKLERGDAALFRYELQRNGDVALPVPQTFEVGETQLRLEQAFLQLVVQPPFDNLVSKLFLSAFERAV